MDRYSEDIKNTHKELRQSSETQNKKCECVDNH